MPNPFNSAYKFEDILTSFGSAILKDRYLRKSPSGGQESPSEMLERASRAYSDDEAHACRMYERSARGHIVYPSPVLMNAGAQKRGLPMSCYLMEVHDNLEDIIYKWSVSSWMTANGGGVGTYVGDIRSMGEEISNGGVTSGLMPFLRVDNELIRSVSQGALRRGAKCIYIGDTHPELTHFLNMRAPSGGDPAKKTLDLHHGVCLSDKFMKAVVEGTDWNLVSPVTGEVIYTEPARRIMSEIEEKRLTTGEPFIVFKDTVQRRRPEVQKKLGLEIKTSNLCSEILLPTGVDHHGVERYGVCCLIALNFEKYDEWGDGKDPDIVLDMCRFADNMMTDFIKRAPDYHLGELAYSVEKQRSLGAGVTGFTSYLQSKMIPFGSVAAQAINKRFFSNYQAALADASRILAEERGPCGDAKEAGLNIRFSNMMAVAPNASSAIIAGETSPGIEPFSANVFTQKTLSGSFVVVNKYLKKILQERGKLNDDIISSIALHEGSVQHLNFLTDEEKEVFLTAFELDQMWIIKHAADRAPFIDQSQSLNVFVPSNVSKKILHLIHHAAWASGEIKTLYYCRSMTHSRADKIGVTKINDSEDSSAGDNKNGEDMEVNPANFEECLACQ